MAKDLGMDASMMNIAVSITALFSGIFIVVFGGLADKVGRVKIIRIGFYFSIIGSLLVGLTPVGNAAEAVLITGRIFQGLSAAAIMPASLALVKAYWEGKERQRAISLWSMGSWGGSGFAALFGGLMVSVGWRWIFFGATAVSVLGLILIKGTPESKTEGKQDKKTDYAGIIIFMHAMIALQLLVIYGAQLGLTSPSGIVLILATLIFSFLFYFIEKKTKDAFIDFKLFHNKIFTGATISNFLLNGTAGILIVSLILLQVGG